MKRYLGHIKMLLLLGFIVLLYGFSAQRNKAKQVALGDPKFENGDNLFITYETVNKLLIQKQAGVQTQPKEDLFLNKLEKNLFSNQMVENAEVFVSVDGKLGAVIRQKTPIARVNHDDYAYYIDHNGKKMPLSENYSARVPIVEGVVNENVSANLFLLLKRINKDEFLRKQVVGIVQKENDEFDLKTRIGNQLIELGSLNKLNSKVKKLKVFYQKSIQESTLNQYKKINLEYNNQVICTKI